MDQVEDVDLFSSQYLFLSRAKALTLAQAVIAQEIAERTLGHDASAEAIATITNALATNYLAAMTQTK